MYEPNRSRRGRTNLASCIVATIFLLFLVAAMAIVFLFVFRPKEPRIAVEAVQFPTFSMANDTINFTFFQNVSVTNPNRDAFTHYDSSLQLVYSGSQVGFAFIPAGRIDAGHTQRMSAKFAVESFPLKSPLTAVTSALDGGVGVGVGTGPVMEIESRMMLVGRVRVLKIFSHRVETGMKCSVAIEVSDGSVLGFHC